MGTHHNIPNESDTPQEAPTSQTESVAAVLARLVSAADNMTGKSGSFETRLVALEDEALVARLPLDSAATSEFDEPLFQSMTGARLKHG